MNKNFLLFGLFFSVQILFAQNESMTPFEQEMDSLLLIANELILEQKLEEGLKITEDSENRIIEKFGNKHWLLIRAGLNKGTYFRRTRKPEKAVENLQISVDLINELYQGEHSSYFSTVTIIGNLLLHLERMEESEKMLLANKEKIETTPEATAKDYFFCLKTLASFYSKTQQFEQSERTLNEALAFGKHHHFDEQKEYVSLLVSAALIYIKTGRYSLALDTYEKGKEIYLKLGLENTIEYAGLFIGETNAAFQTGDLERAETAILIARDLILELDKKSHHIYQICLQSLSAIYGAKEEYQKSIDFSKEIIEQSGKKLNSENIDMIGIYANLAISYFTLEKFEEAEEILLQIVNILTEGFGEKHNNLIHIERILGVCYLHLGDFPEGSKYLKHAGEMAKSKLEKGHLYLSEEELSAFNNHYFKIFNGIFQAAEDFPNAKFLASICYDNALIQKGYSLNAVKNIRKNYEKTPETTQLFNQYKKLNQTLSSELSKPLTEQTSIQNLEQKIKNLEKELVLKTGLSANSFETVNWEDVRANLPKKSAAIEIIDYVPDGKNATNSPKKYAAVILSSEKELPEFIPLFVEGEMHNINNPAVIYSFENGENQPVLKALVWDKIAPSLEGIETIYYAPSGLMHRINFGAIPIFEQKAIADQFEIRSLGSTRQLVVPHETPDYAETDALIFGGVNYSLENKNIVASNSVSKSDKTRSLFFNEDEWRFLKWTEKEADKIGELLTNSGIKSEVLKNEKATEEAFKKIGVKEKSPRILHLATHGYFFSKADTSAKTGFEAAQNPLIRSGLILAGGNAAWVGKAPLSGEDGILTAHEIAQMDLSNTELVVLSACETGLGDIKGSEGVYGLQRAFKLAGVKYILMSLWEVKDRKTYQFMSLFYEKLLSGKSVPKAYQFAQNAMREKYKLPFNPINWAGFVLVE